MNRSESKYFSTAVKMDKAFLELLEKKDFANITVKEICENAGVNRSTFYLHYETIVDLLDESSQYIINQFIEFMPHDSVGFPEKLHTCPIDEHLNISHHIFLISSNINAYSAQHSNSHLC